MSSETKNTKGCPDCYPKIQYLCSKHRKPNQCGGCLRENQKLRVTGIGILCNDCAVSQGVIF